MVVGEPVEVVALSGGRPTEGLSSGAYWHYAVRRGRQTGVYTCWEDARVQVEGFPGALHCKFRDSHRALSWVQGTSDAYPARQERRCA